MQKDCWHFAGDSHRENWEYALMFEKASRSNLLNGWWRWWGTLPLLTVCTHNVVNSYRTMKSFQEHEGTLELTTFTPPFSPLPLDAHWNEWSVEYETISNLISLLEALKNFCHWMCRGDPYCPSAANTPPGSEGIVVSRNTPTAQHEKARVWGWGRPRDSGIGGGLSGSYQQPRKRHQSGPHWVMNSVNSYSWHGMEGWQTREGKKRKKKKNFLAQR